MLAVFRNSGPGSAKTTVGQDVRLVTVKIRDRPRLQNDPPVAENQ
jgi:hypothetical protein